MNDWDEESTEVWTVKKFLPEYITGFINPVIAVVYFFFNKDPFALFKVAGLWMGMHLLSIGLFGTLLKRTWFKGFVYRGEKGRLISASYFMIGLTICLVILFIP